MDLSAGAVWLCIWTKRVLGRGVWKKPGTDVSGEGKEAAGFSRWASGMAGTGKAEQ